MIRRDPASRNRDTTTGTLVSVVDAYGRGDLTVAQLHMDVALFGLAWMADTFIAANEDEIVSTLGGITESAPWTFAIILFAVAALTTSQSGATRSIMPIGIALGIAPQFLVAMWPSVIGIYFFPANGSQIAAVEFDKTGTTKIGKAVVNHSFMPPLLVAWVVAVAVGAGLALVIYGTG